MWVRHLLIAFLYLALFLAYYFWLKVKVSHHGQFVFLQRGISQKFLLTAGIHLGVVVFFYRKLWRFKLKEFFFEPLSPYPLALARMTLFGTIATHIIFYAPQNWAPLAALPESSRQALPLVGWMIDIMPISPAVYNAMLILGGVFGIMAAAGLFSRFSMLLMIPITFYVFGVPQFFGKLSHYQFLLWAAFLMAFSPAGEHWSLDAFFRRLRGIKIPDKPSFNYALPIKLIMLTLAGIYFFSGFRKLYEIGFFWALSDNPVNLLRTEWLEQFNYLPAIRLDRWPVLCSIGALGVIFFEIAYPFLLLGKRSRIFTAIDVMIFHTLNGYFLKIDFVYLKTAHLSFFNIAYWRKWLRSRSHPIWSWLILLIAVQTLGYFTGALLLLPIVFFLAAFDLLVRFIPKRRRIAMMWKVRALLPKPKGAKNQVIAKRKWLRINLITGLLLIALNWTCGAFGIHSWPFSAYPTYSFARNSTIEYAWFIPQTENGETLDLDHEAEKKGFRKENILPLAERVVNSFKWEPASLETNILVCWERWQTELPSLQSSVAAQVVIREFTLDPDVEEKLIGETSLGKLTKSGGKWSYQKAAL